jgi:hypothetical protein
VREQAPGPACEALVAAFAEDHADGTGKHRADRDAPSRYDCQAISIAARRGASSASHDARADSC